ncbi:MAG: hypothetical protein KatS3mg115_2677 [Candidatus Poribacteria bacterium]|nr:MAG: hypothetical protein KatS3mg115_2677 [Candidatus Poribacteria bacterium]
MPLPPLAEQRRIVARIEELMARVREARRLREQAREDAERLWQSVLADTFPRPSSDLPAGWRWVRLGEVCDTSAPCYALVNDPERQPTLCLRTSITGTIVRPTENRSRTVRE